MKSRSLPSSSAKSEGAQAGPAFIVTYEYELPLNGIANKERSRLDYRTRPQDQPARREVRSAEGEKKKEEAAQRLVLSARKLLKR